MSSDEDPLVRTDRGDVDDLAASFGSVVDVAAAGADPSGRTTISPVLDTLRADDTLLYFPPGRYYVDEQFRFTDFENFGLYGEDATLVPANYHDNADGKHKLFRLGTHYAPGERLHVENLTVDLTAEDTGVRAVEGVASRSLVVRDVTVKGRHDSGMWGPGRFVVRDPDGVGLIERFVARDGAAWTDSTPSAGELWRGPSGIVCNDFNEGTVTFRDCELGGFPDNGLYCGGSEGRIVVDGGRYVNSNGNNVRVGGEGSVVRDVTVRVTETFDEAEGEDESYRGIRLQGTTDATVEGCDLTVDVPVSASTGIVVMNGCDGETTVRDCRIRMAGAFNNAIDVAPAAGAFVLHDTEVVQETAGGCALKLDGDGTAAALLADVTVHGDPGHKWNRAAVYNERDDVRFEGVTVEQHGARKRRALENFGEDCTLRDCDFRVPQYPVIDTGQGTRVQNCRFRSLDDVAGYYCKEDAADVRIEASVVDPEVLDDGCDGLDLVDVVEG